MVAAVEVKFYAKKNMAMGEGSIGNLPARLITLSSFGGRTEAYLILIVPF